MFTQCSVAQYSAVHYFLRSVLAFVIPWLHISSQHQKQRGGGGGEGQYK